MWHRRTADGWLTCLVATARRNPRPVVVQLAHSMEHDDAPAGRPPTIAEVCDALNRFTPENTPFAVVFVSAGLDAPAWPRHVAITLTQSGPPIQTGRIAVVS